VKAGIRLSVVGRRDRLAAALLEAIAAAEASTRHGRALHLRLAVDYSARHSLLEAARLFRASSEETSENFSRCLAEAAHDCAPTPDVDLLIRTGGEHRFSDLFGWECAYAELIFTPTMWPDFDGDSLRQAIQEFHRRERRYGTLPAQPSLPESVPPSSPSHPGLAISLPSVL
jgi:undecaprenyl diphosphate synthase